MIRVVVFRMHETLFFAYALELDVAAHGPHAFEAIFHLGQSLDVPHPPPGPKRPYAPQGYEAVWHSGVDLGVLELGPKRSAHVRMALPLP